MEMLERTEGLFKLENARNSKSYEKARNARKSKHL